MIRQTPYVSAVLPAVAALLIAFAPPVQGGAPQPASAAPSAALAIKDIQLSYKRDARVVDSYHGIGPWASGPSFGGATGQDTVEVRAEGVDAAGRAVKINPVWSVSNAALATISPSQGDDVKITVHKAGESKLTISYLGLSKELVVRGQYVNNYMLIEIEQAKALEPAKPNMSTLPQAPPAPKTRNDVSYAAGMNVVKALQEQSVKVDADLLIRGIKDAVSGGRTLLSEDEAVKALQGLDTDDRIVLANLSRKALGERNKRAGEAFLAANKRTEGVVTLPSGLQYKVIKMGEGKKPTANDTVSVQYRATFIDGTEFANTFGKRPRAIPVNLGPKGWTEPLQLMPVGSRWQLFVPPDLAWGERGVGGHGGRRAGGPQPQVVGPNQTVVFDLELLGIQEPNATPAAFDLTAEKSGLAPEQAVEELKKLLEEAGKTKVDPETKDNPQTVSQR